MQQDYYKVIIGFETNVGRNISECLVKATNQKEAETFASIFTRSVHSGVTSLNVGSAKKLNTKEAKNVNIGKCINRQNYNKRVSSKQSAGVNNLAGNDVDWNVIDQLPHNRELDNFSDEEKELR